MWIDQETLNDLLNHKASTKEVQQLRDLFEERKKNLNDRIGSPRGGLSDIWLFSLVGPSREVEVKSTIFERIEAIEDYLKVKYETKTVSGLVPLPKKTTKKK